MGTHFIILTGVHCSGIVPCGHVVCYVCVVAKEVVQYLDKRVAEALKASLADRTTLQYSSQVTQFLLFCIWTCGTTPFLPVDDQVLCRYLVWQSETVDPKNLGGYLSAIRNLHLSFGLPWVDIRDRYRVGWVLKGLRRLIGAQVTRKLPITPELLVRMRQCGKVAWDEPRMVVVWAVMLLAFFTMSRKDNFSVEKADAFNPRCHLTRGDVKVLRSCVLCEFRKSKTNQLGARVHRVLSLSAPGTILDPKEAVTRAFALTPHARPSDPAFMIPSPRGLIPLTHHVLVASLKHCLRAIGVDPSLYSGHSFRRGGATFAHRLGVDPMLIKRMGDWRSDAYMLYIDHNTPEGMVCLPAAMSQACAGLG